MFRLNIALGLLLALGLAIVERASLAVIRRRKLRRARLAAGAAAAAG